MTPDLRERLHDCKLLVESARKTIAVVEPHEVPEIDDIRECFDSADRAIHRVLDQ